MYPLFVSYLEMEMLSSYAAVAGKADRLAPPNGNRFAFELQPEILSSIICSPYRASAGTPRTLVGKSVQMTIKGPPPVR